MSLKVKSQIKKVGFGEKSEKAVVSAQRNETVDSNQLVEQIALRTQMPKGAVNNILEALVDALGTFIQNGHSVRVGRGGKDEEGLGIIYPRLQRSYVKEYEYDENGNVKHDSQGNDVTNTRVDLGVTVGLRPSVYFRHFLNGISINDVTPDGDEDGDNAGNGGSGSQTSGGSTGSGTSGGGARD